MPTPLDAVQAGAADVTSPGPVDTSNLPVQTPQSEIAAPPPDVDGGVQPSQMPSVNASNTQPAQPPKPSMFRNIVRGALAGIEMGLRGGIVGAGIGALAGAADPNRVQQARQNQINLSNLRSYFASLQAAHQYQENAILQHQMSQWPESLQLSKAKIDAPIAEAREKNGWRPVAFGNGVGDKAMIAVTQQLKQIYPKGIPAGMQYLWTSDGVAAYDPNRAGAQALIDDGNLRRVAMGQQPVSYGDLIDKNVTTPAAKTAFLNGTAAFWSPSAKGSTAVARYNAAKGLLAQYQGYDALNQKLPADTPQRDEAHAKMQDTIAHIQAQMDQARKDMDTENELKEQLAERASAARGKAYGMWRLVQAVDPKTNEARFMWAYQAAQQGAAPLAEGAKLEAKGSQLDDIRQGAQNLRSDVQGLKNPFSAAQIVAINAAMRSTDPKAIKQIVDAQLTQTLSPDQEQYVTDLLNMHERAMSLRSVAGQGNQGSDTLRNAVIAMLPQVKDTPDLMMRKLDRFEQQVSILRRGIPTVKRTENKPAATPTKAGGFDWSKFPTRAQ